MASKRCRVLALLGVVLFGAFVLACSGGPKDDAVVEPSATAGQNSDAATSQPLTTPVAMTPAGASGSSGNSTTPNFKVAFIGDTGAGSSARAVLTLIKNEGADMVMHQGDFDYDDDPAKFDTLIDSVLGASYPYFASVGNHDAKRWPQYQAKLKERLARVPGASCSGEYGVNSACTFNGLFFLLEGAGTIGSGHAAYMRDQLAKTDALWRVCSWHVNQTALQLGDKDNDAGWDTYEACRDGGAIIATAHEHSYERTKTLTSMQNQTIDAQWPDPNALRVAKGASFAFVSGLGGESIRDQERCKPATPPYGCSGIWAKDYTSDQGAKYGALFIEFNVDGDPAKARGYFKNIAGETVDSFTIMSQLGS